MQADPVSPTDQQLNLPHHQSYSTDLLSQLMQTPRNIHVDYAKQVLRYVSETMDFGILYKSENLIRLKGYPEVDWADYEADRRSTSEFVFSLGSEAISWSSKKQSIVALSSNRGRIQGRNGHRMQNRLAQKNLEGSGHSHQVFNSLVLRQHKQHSLGPQPSLLRSNQAH